MMSKYSERAKANYKAKLPIYLFHCCVNDNIPKYEQFISFKLDDNIIEKYATHYLQAEKGETIEKKSRNSIYEYIKKNKEINEFKYDGGKYLKDFKNVLSEESFNKIISKDECAYCGISLRQINKLGNDGKLYNKRADTRGYTLEVDRINANKEYTKDNICMSCYWCNNAKTDEFFAKEFKEIARGINRAWQVRLGTEKIDFPEKSDIWTKNNQGQKKGTRSIQSKWWVIKFGYRPVQIKMIDSIENLSAGASIGYK